MKTFYATLIVAFTLVFTSANAGKITAVSDNGDWESASTWDLNRIPQAGDTIIIPTGFTVNVYTNLTVNGDVYVQVAGVLKFNHSAKLNLSAASKVFVMAGGKISSLSTSSSDQLRIGGNTVYKGSSGDLNGPVMLTNNGSQPVAAISLPVKFVSFTLARQQSAVLVQWSTAMETNSSHFIIERSADGTNWTGIGTVKAAGESSSLINYTYTDKTATGSVLYYRIKQVDIDGVYVYTPVKSIKGENGTSVVTVNAASNNTLLIHFSQQVKSNVTMRLVSASGQVVAQQNITNPSGQVVFSTANNSKGIYIVNITDGKDIKIAKQILL